MSLDVILDGIKKKGASKIEDIRNESNQKISEIEAEVTQETNKIKERILSEGRIDLNRKKAIIDQRTEIQILQARADARQTLVQEVLDKVNEKISNYRHDSHYQETLCFLINETVSALKPSLLKEQKIILHFDKKDEGIVKKIENDFDNSINFVFDLDSVLGCNGETSDQKIFVKNTLASRYARSISDIQQYLSLYFEKRISPS